MRRAIVTGAEGFLGRHLVRELRQFGVDVTTLGRLPGTEPSYVAMGDAPWPSSRLAEVMESAEPDVIFHLVGGLAGSAAELEQLNVGVAKSVMQSVRDIQIRPLLVFCGSAAEYGSATVDGVPASEMTVCKPANAYGASKLTQTNAALTFAERTGTPVLIARIFNPIGPGMPPYLALGDFARQIALLHRGQGTLHTGNLRIFRDFLDVDHVVGTMRRLACNPHARGIVNVCSGEPTELQLLVDRLIGTSGKNVTIETNSSRVRPGELKTVVGSTELLRQLVAAPSATDYGKVIARIWRDAKARWA
ncbi:MAG TPA: NAD-dependent epimerase/dehydratase family protein [Acetobacteraceae bacterium]|nr:NAD-dependent epimerase/dehydratase family protein [Acetobacteraceae bacterium]